MGSWPLPAEWAPNSIRLEAESLWSKFGFFDGDIVSQFAPDDLALCEYDVLPEAVRRYLLPLLPDVEVEEYGSCHNPIRAVDFDYHENRCPDKFRGLFVDVTFDQMRELVPAAYRTINHEEPLP